MTEELIAKATATINASMPEVWSALTEPAMIKQFMFGTEVVTDWKVGSPIVWKGVWEGKPYKDKGTILKIEPETSLIYTHFSGMSGQPDVPENYHTMSYSLSPTSEGTLLTLTQDGNKTEEEKIHSEGMWSSMLEGIKKLLEK